MPGNENKTQVGGQTGGENKRRSGEVELMVVSVNICVCMSCCRAQREGVLSISMLIPFPFYIWYYSWCFGDKGISYHRISAVLLLQYITASQSTDRPHLYSSQLRLKRGVYSISTLSSNETQVLAFMSSPVLLTEQPHLYFVDSKSHSGFHSL